LTDLERATGELAYVAAMLRELTRGLDSVAERGYHSAVAERERVYVALGSNVGDRAAHLAYARARLAALPRTRLLKESRIEETAPLGPVPQGPYLNQMVLLETDLAPAELLAHLHAIEAERGRERRVRWGPRT